RLTTSRRTGYRGCRYFVMFRPPSLLTPRVVPTAAITAAGQLGLLRPGYCASLPPHTPDMLTVRIQAIDGTGTFTLPDFQPCRLLIPCSGDFSSGTRGLHLLLGVSLSPCCRFHPAEVEVPHRSDFGTSCCLHPTEAGSAPGSSPFEATLRSLLLRPGDS